MSVKTLLTGWTASWAYWKVIREHNHQCYWFQWHYWNVAVGFGLCLVSHIASHLVFMRWSYLFPPLWAEIRWVILLPFGARTSCLLQSCPWWDFCIPLTCMHADTCVYLCVPVCHWAITATHTWAWLRLVLTQRDQSPEGESWVWAPSSWQQEVMTLITRWLLKYREQRSFFPKGARLAENE